MNDLTFIIKTLKDNEIRMSVWGCGCCGSPVVTFEYKGRKVEESQYYNFDTEEEKWNDL